MNFLMMFVPAWRQLSHTEQAGETPRRVLPPGGVLLPLYQPQRAKKLRVHDVKEMFNIGNRKKHLAVSS